MDDLKINHFLRGKCRSGLTLKQHSKFIFTYYSLHKVPCTSLKAGQSEFGLAGFNS
jgi:hypothetical protein